MTKLFLPGCNGETATYASELLGKTTVHTETSVDYAGADRDNTRYSEAGRALMLPDEIRQMPKYRQLLVVTNTAPPIKAAYPPIYLRKDVAKPFVYQKPDVLRLSDANIPRSGSFARASIESGSSTSAKQKKTVKGKRAKNQSTVSVGNTRFEKTEPAVATVLENNAFFQIDSRGVAADFEPELNSALSKITDAALNEISEQFAAYADGQNRNFLESGKTEVRKPALFLINDSPADSPDFMEQELKTLLFDEQRESFAQADESGYEEILDGFDSEAGLREESAENFSAGGATANREMSLSGTYILTAEDTAREQTESERLKSENENYLSIAQRVL